MRFFISLSYKGTAYSGWQIQDNAVSIQSLLQDAISTALGEKIEVTGTGRTDAGVNAVNYIAHFDTRRQIKEPGKALYKINAILPSDIVVHHLYKVHDEAHARFDATSRSYCYKINLEKDPFSPLSLHCKYPLDIEAMNKACMHLLGKKDFSCFEKVGGNNVTSICDITEACWYEQDESHLEFYITADRFLRNMVRAIVGTLLEVGRGRRSPEWVAQVIESRHRGDAGQSVAARGLFFCGAEFPYDLEQID